MPVHRLDDELVQLDAGEARGEPVDPLAVVMPQHDTLGKLEDPVGAELRGTRLVALAIPVVVLQPEIADVEQAARMQDALDLADDRALCSVTGHAREHGDEE